MTFEKGLPVRIISDADGAGNVYSSEFDVLGTVSSALPKDISMIGMVDSDTEIQVHRYGPLSMSMPAWMAELSASE